MSVCSTACSGLQQRKHQSSALLSLCEGNSVVNSSHRKTIIRKEFPWHDVIMIIPFITECFKPNFIETGDKRVPRKIPGYLCFWVPALKQMLSFWWNFVFGCTRSFHLDNIRHNRWQIFSQNDISCFRAWGWFDYYNVNLPGAHLNIKMLSYQYRDSYDKDKKISWQSYLYNGVSHTWKDSLYVEMVPRGPSLYKDVVLPV